MKATPSPLAWGWQWELAAHKGGRRLCCWDARIAGPYWEVQTWPSAAGSLPRIEARDWPVWRPGGQGSLFPGLQPRACLPHLSPGQQQFREELSRQLAIRGTLRKVWIKHLLQSCSTHHPGHPGGDSGESMPPPNPWGCGSSSPKILQRGQYLMLAKHGHTEAKSTERQQHISESDTENTTSIFFFLSKTCRLVLLSVFSSFLFFSTYLLHIKSCKENSADSRS